MNTPSPTSTNQGKGGDGEPSAPPKSPPAAAAANTEISKVPWLTNTKDFLAALQSIFTIGALIAAGWWFFTGRQNQTRIKIDESVSHRPDPQDSRFNIVAIDVRVTNTANVLIELNDGQIDVDAVRTPAKSLFQATVKGFRLEPNETEQVFFRVFKLASDTKTIQIYSKFYTPDQRFVWHLAGAFDVANTDHGTQKSTSE